MKEREEFSPEDPELDPEDQLDPEWERRLLQDRRFRSLLRHLAGAGERQEIFRQVEDSDFLAQQSSHFGRFEPSGEDIERYAFPAAIAERDWRRFLHYALLALNLRGVAEALSEPAILEALAEGGRPDLAQDAAGRIATPLRRAQPRAVLADTCRESGDLFAQLVQQVTEDLDTLPPPAPEDREEHVAALCAMAHSLGPDLKRHWPSWIERLAPEAADARRVWCAVAEGWLAHGKAADPDLWSALARLDPGDVVDLAPRLAALGGAEPREILSHVDRLLQSDRERFWHAAARFLSCRAEKDSAGAQALWDELAVASPVPWSPALVDAGAGLLRRLGSDQIEKAGRDIADPAARAALYVVALEHPQAEHRLSPLALAAVHQIPDAEERLHWSLRYLATRPPAAQKEVQGQVGAVLRYLSDLRYVAPAADLARYLDLVARFLERELPYEVENVLWSPAGKPETLRVLVDEAQCPRVLENILENAERYAAAVAPTEAEGFQLRGEILIRAACRLCTSTTNLTALQQAAERLLPEEEDTLRATLARALAARNPSKELIDQVCDGIHDRRRKLLTQLEALPPEHRPQNLLAPASLYSSLASIEAVEDERLGLSALLENPLQLQELAAKTVARMHDRERQNQALLRLAWHALGFESSVFGKRQDRAAAVELVRASLAVGSDLRLAALTPEIAYLGAQRGGSLAVAEFQEAARRVAALEAVPWPRRRDALERVLCYASQILDSGRRLAAVLETVRRLPDDMDDGPAKDEVRRHWHEILPLLTTLADRASGKPEPPDLAAGVQQLPPGAERDEACLRLLRHGWVTAEAARSVAALVQDSDLQVEARLWLGPRRDPGPEGTSWLHDFGTLVARNGADPFDPLFEPLLRRLWNDPPDDGETTLAQAVLNALRAGGRERGEAALRLWLHAHLRPRPGTPQPDRGQRCAKLQEVMQLALVLSTPTPAAAAAPSTS